MIFVGTPSKGSRRWRRNQRLKCECGGYHFPHRRGGGACAHSKTCRLHWAIRGGDPDDIANAKVEHAMANTVLADPAVCPF